MLDLAMKVEWCFGVIRWDKIFGVRGGFNFGCQSWDKFLVSEMGQSWVRRVEKRFDVQIV